MELKDLAAFVGGVTGPLSLGWAIYRYVKERPQLKVEGEIAGEVTLGSNGKISSRRSWLVVRVTNIGKSPIVITGVFPTCGDEKISLKDRLGIPKQFEGSFSFMTKNMPITLNEAQFYQDKMELDEGLANFIRINAHTSTGLIYSNSLKNSKNIKKRVSQELAEMRKLQSRDTPSQT